MTTFLVAVWTGLVVGAAIVTADSIDRLLPRWEQVSDRIEFEHPESRAYRSVTAKAESICRADGLMAENRVRHVVLSLITSEGQELSRRLEVAGPLPRDAIAAWMKDAGIDVSPAPVQREINLIASRLQDPDNARSLSRRGSVISSGQEFTLVPDRESGPTIFLGIRTESGQELLSRFWPAPVIGLLGLLGWLWGIRWLARRFGSRG